MTTLNKDGSPRKPRPNATDETKRLMSETRKGRVFTTEHREALRQAHIRRALLSMGCKEFLEEIDIRILPPALQERAKVLAALIQK